MKLRNKKVYHFSIIGVLVFYLLISLCNIFLLPNLSVLSGLDSRVDKQSSVNLIAKGAELARQFKCVLDERKKAPALSQISLLLNTFIILGFFISLFRYITLLLPSSRNVHQNIPIYVSVRVFRI